jgi:tetratricopeptide (TPR) repeat protein
MPGRGRSEPGSTAYHTLGQVLKLAGKPEEAVLAYRQAVTHMEKAAAEMPGLPACRAELAVAHGNLATVLTSLGQYREAETARRQAVGILEQLVTETDSLPGGRLNLALGHAALGSCWLAPTGRRGGQGLPPGRDRVREADRRRPYVVENRRGHSLVHAEYGEILARGPRRRGGEGPPARWKWARSWPRISPTTPGPSTTWPGCWRPAGYRHCAAKRARAGSEGRGPGPGGDLLEHAGGGLLPGRRLEAAVAALNRPLQLRHGDERANREGLFYQPLARRGSPLPGDNARSATRSSRVATTTRPRWMDKATPVTRNFALRSEAARCWASPILQTAANVP